jgi:hypothetical protein
MASEQEQDSKRSAALRAECSADLREPAQTTMEMWTCKECGFAQFGPQPVLLCTNNHWTGNPCDGEFELRTWSLVSRPTNSPTNPDTPPDNQALELLRELVAAEKGIEDVVAGLCNELTTPECNKFYERRDAALTAAEDFLSTQKEGERE